jgi:hypothetical protein
MITNPDDQPQISLQHQSQTTMNKQIPVILANKQNSF